MRTLIRVVIVAACVAFGLGASEAGTASRIAAGAGHTCALTPEGGVVCWGSNQSGQIGNGSVAYSQLTPAPVSGLTSGATAITAGHQHTCALTTEGGVLCWGDNYYGQLGDGTTADRLTPTPVAGLGAGVTAISAGLHHTCALTAAGGVKCWGGNSDGQLGDGTTTDRLVPTPAAGLGAGMAAMSAGYWHSCAVTTGGGAVCWGFNSNGQLGDGTTTQRLTPTAVNGLASEVAAIAAGSGLTCALTVDEGVKCWGVNSQYQLGLGDTTDRLVPTAVGGLTSGISTIAVGEYGAHACAMTNDGAARCWGFNGVGQIGDGTTADARWPVQPGGLGSDLAEIAVGGMHTCALTTLGGVLCWGDNTAGAVGDGTTTRRLTPTPVSELGNTVTSVTPASGGLAGGTTVTVTGTAFRTGAVSVLFGATPATDALLTSPTTITAVTPAHAAGPVDVVVTDADSRTATLAAGFTYGSGTMVGSPSVLDFGTVLTGSSPVDRTLTVTNTGDGPLSGWQWSFGGLGNPVGGTCGSAAANPTGLYSLTPGQSCTFVLRFTPSSLGQQGGTLSVSMRSSAAPPETWDVSWNGSWTAVVTAPPPTGAITGTVRDAGTGAPLSNVTVRLYTATGSNVGSVITDASGVYTLPGLAASMYFVRTSNSLGYVDELHDNIPCLSCSVTTGTAVAVVAGTTTAGIDFALSRGARFTGTVTDAVTGLPLANVSVYTYDGSGRQAGTSVTTNASGVYTTYAVVPGTYYLKTSNSLGYVDEVYNNLPCSGCTVTTGAGLAVTGSDVVSGIDFALEVGGTISGTVTDADTGAPLSSVTVRYYSASGNSISSVTTNAFGVYTTTGLATGAYFLRTSNTLGYVDELHDDRSCPWGACRVTEGAGVGVTVGAETSGVDFSLVKGGTIAGTVTATGSGAPLAGVSVTVYIVDPGRGYWGTSSTTDASGAYTKTGLPTGTYFLRTSSNLGYVDELYSDLPCPGGACSPYTNGTPVNVTAGTTTSGVDFGLATGGAVAGAVTAAASGTPLSGVTVQVYSAAGTSVGSVTTDATGAYLKAGLPTGTYYIRTSNSLGYVDEVYSGVLCAGGACPSVTTGIGVSVTAGATTGDIDFAIGLGASISGTVRDAAGGAPLANVTVYFYNAAGTAEGSVTSDGSGNYSRARLPAGTHHLVTSNSQGYVDELFQDIPCPQLSCVISSGTGILLEPGASVVGIDITLGRPAGGDYTPPELVSLSWTPVAVDTSTASRTIVVTARITDDLAGNAGAGYTSSPSQALFKSPSGNQSAYAMLSGSERISGTALDGEYQFGMTVPAFAESGVWTLHHLLLVDQVGNMRTLYAADLAAAGFPTTFTQTGSGDTTAPQLVSLSWTPTVVNAAAGAQTIVVTARITDDLAGNAGAGYTSSPSQALFKSPSGNQSAYAMLSGSERISGTALDGEYQFGMTVPAFAESGVWTLHHLILVDQVGNTRTLYTADVAAAGFPTTFTQTGSGDTTAPQLVSLSWTPTVVNAAAGAQTIAVTARITDDVSGNAGAGYTSSPSQALFRSPSGNQSVYAMLSGSERISGTALDGEYQFGMTVPAFAESGVWTLHHLMLVDQVGNTRTLYTADVAAAGFPTTFTVLGSTPTRGDFDGDGSSDILWRHGTQGDVWLWGMDGGVRTAETYVSTVAESGWEIRGLGDQTGDGKADLLWRHAPTGMVYLWTINGSAVEAETYVGTVEPAFDIVGTGDYDGDGKSDILWRHQANGQLWLWLMDGPVTQRVSYVDTVDPAYEVQGSGDLNGDGKADIVWRNSAAGDVWVWLMDGPAPQAVTYVYTVGELDYRIVGVADHTGDGKADLLWHHDTRGEVWLWPMDGATPVSQTYVDTVPETDYRIVGNGDYDGDGKADILWHHATRGEVWVWLMDGASTVSVAYVGAVPDTSYRIIGRK